MPKQEIPTPEGVRQPVPVVGAPRRTGYPQNDAVIYDPEKLRNEQNAQCLGTLSVATGRIANKTFGDTTFVGASASTEARNFGVNASESANIRLRGGRASFMRYGDSATGVGIFEESEDKNKPATLMVNMTIQRPKSVNAAPNPTTRTAAVVDTISKVSPYTSAQEFSEIVDRVDAEGGSSLSQMVERTDDGRRVLYSINKPDSQNNSVGSRLVVILDNGGVAKYDVSNGTTDLDAVVSSQKGTVRQVFLVNGGDWKEQLGSSQDDFPKNRSLVNEVELARLNPQELQAKLAEIIDNPNLADNRDRSLQITDLSKLLGITNVESGKTEATDQSKVKKLLGSLFRRN